MDAQVVTLFCLQAPSGGEIREFITRQRLFVFIPVRACQNGRCVKSVSGNLSDDSCPLTQEGDSKSQPRVWRKQELRPIEVCVVWRAVKHKWSPEIEHPRLVNQALVPGECA